MNTCLASNEELHASRHANRASLDLAAVADTMPLTVDSRASSVIRSASFFDASLDAADAAADATGASKLVIVFSVSTAALLGLINVMRIVASFSCFHGGTLMDLAQYKHPFIPKCSRTATSSVFLRKMRKSSLPTEKASQRMQPIRCSLRAVDLDTSHVDGKATTSTAHPTAAWAFRPLRVAPGPSTMISTRFKC